VYWRDISPSDVAHCWAELVEQIFGVVLYTLLSFLLFFWFDCDFVLHLVARLDLDMLLLLVVILVISCR